MPDPSESDGWIEYRRLVMDAIARLEAKTVAISVDVQGLRSDLVAQKTKIAAGAAVVAMLASAVVSLLVRKFGG